MSAKQWMTRNGFPHVNFEKNSAPWSAVTVRDIIGQALNKKSNRGTNKQMNLDIKSKLLFVLLLFFHLIYSTYNNMVEPQANNLKNPFPHYLIIPIALVQSQLYWICSAVCWVFKESGIIHEEQKSTISVKRIRAKSEPTSRPRHRITKKPSRRRVSLPEPSISVRNRPTVHDELNGTTCPPVWWQKTRVRLGHTPVHGDPKPLKNATQNNSELSSTTSSMSRTTSNSSSHSNESNNSKNSKRKFIFKLFHHK